MVFVFDLDDEASNVPIDPRELRSSMHNLSVQEQEEIEQQAAERNPNVNLFSAALACYPVVSSLASFLDLNSLHNLSRTCRQFRGTLLLYRDQLVSRTLHCHNESGSSAGAASVAWKDWRSTAENERSRMTRGKAWQCARDMVGECRKCGIVVCRNCAAKPPPTPQLKDRHRRLCYTCLKAPLASHLTNVRGIQQQQHLPRKNADRKTSSSSFASTTSLRSHTPTPSTSPLASRDRLHSPLHTQPKHQPAPLPSPQALAPIHPAFRRTPCACPRYILLCTPCGSSLRAADVMYARGRDWRSKYGSYTGIGEGHKGVECGRRSACLAARLVEQELDHYGGDGGDGAEGSGGETPTGSVTGRPSSVLSASSGRSWEGPSFEVQEIQGIGGVVKMKVKRLVRVGAEVDEAVGGEDEAHGAHHPEVVVDSRKGMDDEIKGEIRSWCAWCERVVPSMDDGWRTEWDVGVDS